MLGSVLEARDYSIEKKKGIYPCLCGAYIWGAGGQIISKINQQNILYIR